MPFGGVFNFAAMNNAAAELVQTSAMLFLNDDVTCTTGGWSELLAGYLARPRVGIAGATLWYPSGELQHAGIVTGIGDGVGHAGRNMCGSDIWPWLLAAREVSAVTGACLAIRTDLFRAVGGFDSGFANNYNDVDFAFGCENAASMSCACLCLAWCMRNVRPARGSCASRSVTGSFQSGGTC